MLKNEKMIILKVAIDGPFYHPFDYLLPVTEEKYPALRPGIRVKVPFGTRYRTGILLSITDQSALAPHQLKAIHSILDDVPVLSDSLLNLCSWASDYYHHPLGEVLFHAIPTTLRAGKPTILTSLNTKPIEDHEVIFNTHTSPIQLNPAQQQAVDTISQHLNEFICFLLDGITSSGKTEVYLQVIEQVLKKGKQALVLVPEIALTPQMLARFQQRFAEFIVPVHSAMTDKERLIAWTKAQTKEAKVIIGTRSSIFTPFQSLGIIIVDEEHDLSFKQQEGFRYSARNLAVMRSHFEKIPIILGSATPSLETLYHSQQSQYSTLYLPERAGHSIHPHYHIIDIRNKAIKHGLSKPLLDAIKQHLDANNQVLLFLNRREYAPTIMCHACGWIAKCSRCDAHMILHKNPPHLHCHHCDKSIAIPTHCPQCNNKHLQSAGVGTERLEHALYHYFPDIPITRIDRDTTRRKEALHDLLNQVNTGERQILIGTQMIAKGHHFPNVTLVGIINLDAGFFSADFRTTERTAQLLIQVAGRAGRAEKPGEVLIQTHYPQHPLLLQLIHKGYADFAKASLKERQSSQLPPYAHLVLLRAESLKPTLAMAFLQEVKALKTSLRDPSLKILGPIPAPMQKRKGYFHAQLLLQSNKRHLLHQLLNEWLQQIGTLPSLKSVRWSLDVDPMEMF
jgi:primosomal protein N' (replication factor Y) (superfamily II helicase)